MEQNGVSPNLARWSERLKDLTVTPLTRDYPEPPSGEAIPSRRPIEAVETLAASTSVADALHILSSFANPYELLLTSYVILISRLTGDEDIPLGTNAKPDGQAFVLRTSVSPQETFTHLLSRVKDVR
jgi:L-2-aminoadipate reductase